MHTAAKIKIKIKARHGGPENLLFFFFFFFFFVHVRIYRTLLTRQSHLGYIRVPHRGEKGNLRLAARYSVQSCNLARHMRLKKKNPSLELGTGVKNLFIFFCGVKKSRAYLGGQEARVSTTRDGGGHVKQP